MRSDSTVAGYQAMGESGLTIASTFLVSYKLSPSLAPLMRIAITRDAPPAGASAVSLSNPLFGVLWSKPLAAPFKLALFGAVTLPVGSGGGNTPNAERATAQRAAIVRARPRRSDAQQELRRRAARRTVRVLTGRRRPGGRASVGPRVARSP